MMYLVYKHITPSEKIYIGITKQSLCKRWRDGYGYTHNDYFYKAIQKYGWNNIKHEVIAEGLTKEEACKLEIELIARYKSNIREFGYNITMGGDGVNGYKHSEESKAKINNKFQKGCKPYNYGKHLSEEQKRKLSEAHKGKPSPRKGCKLTKEQIEKMRKSLSIPISQFDKEGNFIKHWDSAKIASITLNISYSCINGCCKGHRKTAGNYIWRYRKENVK